MSKPELTISAIRTTEELADVWAQTEELPNVEGWGEAIKQGLNDALVARIGDKAIGYVTIRWGGPKEEEGEFFQTVNEHFPENGPVPAIMRFSCTRNIEEKEQPQS